MQLLKQSTAATVVLGPFMDDTDGKTVETALTIAQADIRLSKNGGAFAQTNNIAGATHMENGYYSVPLDATDTGTLGRLTVAVSESGALPEWREFMVVPANVYDALVGGSDKLQVDAVEVSSSTTAADNVEANIGNLDAAVSGRAPASTALSNATWTDARAGKLENLDAAVSTRSSHSAADVWAVGTRTLTSFGTLVADIWAALTSGMTTAGSIGKKLADWVLGTDNKVLVSGDTHTSGQTVANLTDKTGFAIGVGGIGASAFAAGAIDNSAIAADAIGAAEIAVDAIGASELAADAAAEIADKVLGRNLAGGSDGGRTVKDALRILRNKRSITGGTLTVTAEDDTTPAWTAAVGTAASDPVNSIDPA